MAGEDRTAAPAVVDELLRDPKVFAFAQAVRLLQAADGRSVEQGAADVGAAGPVEDEVLRFRPNATLGFPTADIEAIDQVADPAAGRPRHRVTVNFMGLYGPASPLPAFYTEDILMAGPDDSARRDFLDVFHHRLIALHYRAWQKYRHHMRYRPGAADRFSGWMFALMGLGEAKARRGLALEHTERLLPSLGLLAMRGRSAATVAGIVSYYFDGLPVAVREFVERSVPIAAEQRARLGRAGCTLAADCTIGAAARDVAGKFRIAIGPVGLERFLGLLPDQPDFRALVDLINFLLKDPLAFDVELTLDRRDLPDLRLGQYSDCRLGWSTWLGAPPPGDPSVVLRSGAWGGG